MNNWYEASIKSLVEEYFKNNGFDFIFDPSEFWDVNMKKWLMHIPSSQHDVFISLRAAYCAGNNLDFIVKKAIRSVKQGGIIMFSISNGYIDVSNGNLTPIKGVYNPENNHCDETETARNINWMKNAMLTNGCSEVTLTDAESEILLISKR